MAKLGIVERTVTDRGTLERWQMMVSRPTLNVCVLSDQGKPTGVRIEVGDKNREENYGVLILSKDEAEMLVATLEYVFAAAPSQG